MMAWSDVKWLSAIIEASGAKTTALALGSAAVVFGSHYDVLGLGDLDRWVVQVGTVAMLVFGSLSLVSIVTAISQRVRNTMSRFQNARQKRRALEAAEQAVRDYLPHLTEKERQIIGYLLEKNQKTFEATPDGGYARMLLARRLVVIAAQPGQHVDQWNVPMAIPDHAWKVFQENRELFPYRPEYRSSGKHRTEMQPWRAPVI